MKRVVIAFAAIALLAVASTSCKSHERCPAYGKVNTTSEAKV